MSQPRYQATRAKIDELEERARASSGRRRRNKKGTIAPSLLRTLVAVIFPDAILLGQGWSKTVYEILEGDRLVLKVGDAENTRITMQAYATIVEAGFGDRLAEVFYSTEHCILQELGEQGPVPEIEASLTKKLMAQFGVTDVRPANFMRFGDQWKIIDCSPKGLNSFSARKRAREGIADAEADPYGFGFVSVGSKRRPAKW